MQETIEGIWKRRKGYRHQSTGREFGFVVRPDKWTPDLVQQELGPELGAAR